MPRSLSIVLVVVLSVGLNGCNRNVAKVLVGAATKLSASAWFHNMDEHGVNPYYRNPQEALRDDVFFGKQFNRDVKVTEVVYDGHRAVEGRAWGVRRVAVWRDGFGVTLVPDDGVIHGPRELAIPPAPTPTPLPRAVLPHPYDGQLDTFLDGQFEPKKPLDTRRTRAVMVVYRDHVVKERYADGFDSNYRFLSWSMAKSFTNALTGILVDDGCLDVYGPAPVPEWTGDARKSRITINDLLQMNSGLYFRDWLQQSTTQTLFRVSDMARYYADKEARYEPGEHHFYANGAATLMARIVQDTVRVTPKYHHAGDTAERAVHLFPYRYLFHEIGMSTARFEVDPVGTFVGSSYIYARAEEFARFGLLYLHDGVWNGKRLLPEWWIDYSKTSTPISHDGEYGAFFWTNDQRAWGTEIPADAFECTGFEGQLIAMIPSRHLVVVRLGHSLLNGFDHRTFLEGLLKTLPPATLELHPSEPRRNERLQTLLDEIRARHGSGN